MTAKTLTITAPHDPTIFAYVTPTGSISLYQRQPRSDNPHLLGTLDLTTTDTHLPHHIILDRVADALATYRP